MNARAVSLVVLALLCLSCSTTEPRGRRTTAGAVEPGALEPSLLEPATLEPNTLEPSAVAPRIAGPLPATLLVDRMEVSPLNAAGAAGGAGAAGEAGPGFAALPFGVEERLRMRYTTAVVEGVEASGVFLRVILSSDLPEVPLATVAPLPRRAPASKSAPEKTEKTEKTEKPEKTETTENTEKTDKPEKTETTEKTDKPEPTEKTAPAAAPGAKAPAGKLAAKPALPPSPPRPSPADFRLRSRVSTIAEKPPADRISTLAGVVNGLSWFLLMVPSWFLPDHAYEPTAKLSFEVFRESPARGGGVTIDPGPVDLNFLDRASTGEYFLQIIVPAPLVPSDEETVHDVLMEHALGKIRLQTEAYFRTRFAVDQASGGEPFLLPLSWSGAERRGSIVFLPGEITSLEVDEKPAPGSTAAGGFQPYVAASEQKEAAKARALDDLRGYLAAMAPGVPIPTAADLDGKYVRVYLFPDILEGSKDQRIRVTCRTTADAEPMVATWTMPRAREAPAPAAEPAAEKEKAEKAEKAEKEKPEKEKSEKEKPEKEERGFPESGGGTAE